MIGIRSNFQNVSFFIAELTVLRSLIETVTVHPRTMNLHIQTYWKRDRAVLLDFFRVFHQIFSCHKKYVKTELISSIGCSFNFWVSLQTFFYPNIRLSSQTTTKKLFFITFDIATIWQFLPTGFYKPSKIRS